MPILNGIETNKLYTKVNRPLAVLSASEWEVIDSYLSHISFDEPSPAASAPTPKSPTQPQVQVVEAPTASSSRLQRAFSRLRVKNRARALTLEDIGPLSPPELSPSRNSLSEAREPEGNAFIDKYFGDVWRPNTPWERTALIAHIEDKAQKAGQTAIATKARKTLLLLVQAQISKETNPISAAKVMGTIDVTQHLWLDDIDLKAARKTIGEGTNGSVARYTINDRRPRAGTLLAVKTAHDDDISKRELFNEIMAMIALQNTPNVMQFDGLFIGRQLGVVSMFMNSASLLDFIDANEIHYAYTSLDIAAQIVNGVNGIHKKGWFHGDLKPANILVSVVRGKIVIRIADLATARKMNGTQYTITDSAVVTTWVYCDPDEMQKDIYCRANNATAVFNYGPPQDAYSLAYVLYLILTSKIHAVIEQTNKNFKMIAQLEKELKATPDDEILKNDIAKFKSPETEMKIYVGDWDNNRAWDQRMIDEVVPPIPALHKAITLCWGRTPAERASLDTVLETLREGLRVAPEPPATMATSLSIGDISKFVEQGGAPDPSWLPPRINTQPK